MFIDKAPQKFKFLLHVWNQPTIVAGTSEKTFGLKFMTAAWVRAA
jgi:hypothetical protein